MDAARRWMLGVVLSLTLHTGNAAFAQPATARQPDDAIPVQDRLVSLTAQSLTRRAALKELCRQASVSLDWDDLALAATKLKPDELANVTIVEQPLRDALGMLIEWEKHNGVYYEVRGDVLRLSTLAAKQAWDRQHTPAWMAGIQGLHVQVDPSGAVEHVHAGGMAITDDLLARFDELSTLRKLNLSSVKQLTAVGIGHLSKLAALEELELHSTDGLGDAVLPALRGHTALRRLSISECGTTDAGIAALRDLPNLQHLSLYQEGRLTDAAIETIATLKQLKSLNLTSHVATQQYGKMAFTSDVLAKLAALQELEVLTMPGLDFPPGVLPLPRLRALTLSGPNIDDKFAERIAQCLALRSVDFDRTQIGDDTLHQMSGLIQLTRLSIRGGRVTDAGIAWLTLLPHLSHVKLYGLPITNDGIAALANIPTLTRLDLASGRVDATGLSQLKTLPRLRTLWLHGMRDPAGFADLKALQQLRELHFEMCTIDQRQFDSLEATLPETRIMAGNSGGFLRSSRKKPLQLP